MDESEFRSFWVAFGSALGVGGFVVSSSSGVTLLVTSPSHAEFWTAFSLIIFSVVVAIVGFGTVVAAVSERWLPGRDKMLQRVKRKEDTRFLLMKYVALGLIFSRQDAVTGEQFFEWSVNQLEFISQAWGLDAPLHNMVHTSGESPKESFKSAVENLTDFMRLTRDIPLRKGFVLDLNPRPDWLEYIDSHSTDNDQESGSDSSSQGST
jgi:hypothetical protein